jgi:hypothetical protein
MAFIRECAGGCMFIWFISVSACDVSEFMIEFSSLKLSHFIDIKGMCKDSAMACKCKYTG